MQTQEVTDVIRLYPLGTMNVCKEINWNQSNTCELMGYFSMNESPQAMMLVLKTEMDISEKETLVNEIQDIF